MRFGFRKKRKPKKPASGDSGLEEFVPDKGTTQLRRAFVGKFALPDARLRRTLNSLEKKFSETREGKGLLKTLRNANSRLDRMRSSQSHYRSYVSSHIQFTEGMIRFAQKSGAFPEVIEQLRQESKEWHSRLMEAR